MDSALAMQCKEAGRRLQDMLERVGAAIVRLIEENQDTLLMSRHRLQPASPIYLAWKLAGWLDPLQRSRRHLRAALLDVAVLQFGGPDGTLSSQGPQTERSLAVAQRLADALGLMMPAASWHTTRDRFVRLGTELAMLCGTLGKIGQDIALLTQAEIGELFASHSAAKLTAWFAAGMLLYRNRQTDLSAFAGAGRQAPIIFALFILAVLSLGGIAPLAGFGSLWLMINGAFAARHAEMIFVLAAVAILHLLAFAPFVHAGFCQPPAGQVASQGRNAPAVRLLPLMAAGALTLGLGLIPFCLSGAGTALR